MPVDIKTEILHKSLQQFQKHGIREMSNEKLVQLLGISTKTIYKYFKNKEDLVEEVMYLHHAQQFEMLKNRPAGKSSACLLFDIWQMAIMAEYDVNNNLFRDLHYYYPELQKKIEASVSSKFTQEFLNIIYRGIEEGSFRNDIMPEVILENIFVQYEATARSERFKRFRLNPGAIMLNTIATTIRGICSVKTVQVLDEYIKTRQELAKGKSTGKKTGLKPSFT